MTSPAAPARDGQQAPDKLTQIVQMLNWIVFFFLFQNIVGSVVQKFAVPPNKSDVADTNVPANPLHRQTPHRTVDGKPSCLWPQGTVMDLDVVITDSSTPPGGWTWASPTNDDDIDVAVENKANPHRTKISFKKEAPLASWRQENLILGGLTNTAASSAFSAFGSSANQEMNYRNATLDVTLTDALWNNETHLYAHVRLTRRVYRGQNINRHDSKDGHVKKEDVLVKRVELTRHRKRKKKRDEKSLLDTTESNDKAVKSSTPSDNTLLTLASHNKTHDQILLYLKPSLTLQMVDLGTALEFPNRQSIPRQFSDHMDWYEGNNVDAFRGGARYYPILYVSEFWITYDSLKEVNGGLKESKIDVTYEPVPMWKWQLQAGMEDSQRKQEAFTGEEDSSNDTLLTMLIETNPYLLAVTAIVSILHSIFDILAFKNDISFYKNKKSMEGLSLRSMVVNCFFSFVILLYLADNDTSYMVLASNGVGLLIDVWKISKAITIKFEGGKIEWVESRSYKKSRTKEYDEIATSHLLFVTMPLVAGYGMYSLFYQKHKSWYSWILNTLVGFIYMFGFVMMTPQLFINYKLQSVAHLNWRTMTYKSINTFIDDLFAFVIKMPIMHRLACLRDDVIFFIFCYQRYKYKTDYSRVNEFGQCVEPAENMLEEKRREEEATPLIVASDDINTDNQAIVLEQTSDNASTLRKRRGAKDRIRDS